MTLWCTVHKTKIVKLTAPWLCTVGLPLHTLDLHVQWREITDKQTDEYLKLSAYHKRLGYVPNYRHGTEWRHNQGAWKRLWQQYSALCHVDGCYWWWGEPEFRCEKVREGRRKCALSSFIDFCVAKDGEVMEVGMYCSVTSMGVTWDW
jgi:hypothetical protein